MREFEHERGGLKKTHQAGKLKPEIVAQQLEKNKW
jgi:hypothetical protein